MASWTRAVSAVAVTWIFAARAWGAEPDTPVPPASPAAEDGDHWVLIDSTRPSTVIERRANRIRGWAFTVPAPAYNFSDQWESVCVAPCRVRLDPNGVYQVAGGGVAPSSMFTVANDPHLQHLHVRAGSSFLHTTGIFTTAFGASALLVSGFFFASSSQPNPGTESDIKHAGTAIGISGLALVAIGIPLWLLTASQVDGARDL